MREAGRAPRIGSAALAAAAALAAPQAHATDAPAVALIPELPVAPFYLSPDSPSRARAQQCLAAAVYYEAGNQPLVGRQAVAQVVLNRVRHPVYPKSVCGVVFQGASRPGCQFTFACDGSLSRAPDPSGWAEADRVAGAALDGFVSDAVSASTHYHALYVRPAWSGRLLATQRIGAHQFYRFPGANGEVARLVGVYAGAEPEPSLLIRPPSLSRFAAAVGSSGRSASRTLAPAPAAFTVWGLGVALATPERDGTVHVAWQAPS